MNDSPSSPSDPAIQRWSTRGVSPARRLDLYGEALTCAVDPMHVTSGRKDDFNAEVRSGHAEARPNARRGRMERERKRKWYKRGKRWRYVYSRRRR